MSRRFSWNRLRSGVGLPLVRPVLVVALLLTTGCSGALPGSRPPPPQPSDPAAAPPADVSGRWEGIYNTRPEIMRLVLELRTRSDGVVEGEVSFRGLVEPEHFRIGTGVSGSFTVRGRYDPTAGLLDLEPERWIERPTTAAPRALPIRAVYDSGYGAFAGLFPANVADRYFALARPERAEALLLEPARYASVQHGTQRLPFGLGGRTETETILDWASRLTTEFPDLDPYRETIPAVENLFADPHFEPHFGSTYDRLNPLKRREIFLKLRQDPELQPFVGLASTFQDTGLPATRSMAVQVLGQRILRSWIEGTTRRTTAWPGTADAWSALARTQAAATSISEVLFPSERTAFAARLEAGAGELAGRVLERRLTELEDAGGDLPTAVGLYLAMVGGAGVPAPPRPDGGALPERVPDLATLWALAPAEARTALEPAADRALQRMVTEAVAEDRARVDALGTGLDGLSAGAHWHRGAHPLYAQLPTTPGIEALFDTFERRRSELLDQQADALAARIRGAESARTVDRLLADYVGLPSDWADPAGSRLLDLGTARSNELRAIAARNERWARAIKKAGLALAGEAVRRAAIEEESVLLLAAATLGRDLAIQSALRDAFPDADEGTRRYMARGFSTLLSGDHSAGGMASAMGRETFVQWWEREYPDVAGAAAFADFGADLLLEMRGWGR